MIPPLRVLRDVQLASRFQRVEAPTVSWVALDEVGRGAIAGPLVVCGTLWQLSPEHGEANSWPTWLNGVRDSKKLTPQARQGVLAHHPWASRWQNMWEEAQNQVLPADPPPLGKPSVAHLWREPEPENPLSFSSPYSLECLGTTVGLVGARWVDSWGLRNALGWAAATAIHALEFKGPIISYLLCDGKVPFSLPRALQDIPQQMAIGGDDLFASIGFSSVVAKVLRDSHMEHLESLYPGYGLSSHKGYGTHAHRLAVAQKGPISGMHRITFLPKAPKILTSSLF